MIRRPHKYGQRSALAPTKGPAAVLNLPRQRQIH